MNTDEQWKSIPGHEDKYEASDLGRIRNKKTKRILSPNKDPKGYYRISLHRNGEQITARIHNLVMLAFNGVRPTGYDVNHINLNKQDNSLKNLEYLTHADNIKHFLESGIGKRINKAVNNRKLTHENVIAIKEHLLKNKAMTYREIGGLFNVSITTIKDINFGWRWIGVGEYEYPIRARRI